MKSASYKLLPVRYTRGSRILVSNKKQRLLYGVLRVARCKEDVGVIPSKETPENRMPSKDRARRKLYLHFSKYSQTIPGYLRRVPRRFRCMHRLVFKSDASLGKVLNQFSRESQLCALYKGPAGKRLRKELNTLGPEDMHTLVEFKPMHMH